MLILLKGLPSIYLFHVHTSKKVLHHLGSTSSGTFTYKWNRNPYKQHFSSLLLMKTPYCMVYHHTFRSCGPDCNIHQLRSGTTWTNSALTNLWIVCHDGYGHASMQEVVLLGIKSTGLYCNLEHNFWKFICMMEHQAICGFHEQ